MRLQLAVYPDPRAFHAAVIGRLLEAEAENCSLLGVIGRLAAGYAPASADEVDQPLLWTVADDAGRVDVVAVQTLRTTLLVSRVSSQSMECLADHLARRAWSGHLLLGVSPSIGELAHRYAAAVGRSATRCVQLRTMLATTVTPPVPVAGRMRPCVPADRPTIGQFIHDFEADIREPSLETPLSRADRLIAGGRLFAWVDGDDRPRSMAGWAGPTPNGVRVNSVYTPPEHRGRGHASNLVAALTRHLLAGGRRFCFLHADAANPTSNGIYQRLGYRHVCDGERWKVA